MLFSPVSQAVPTAVLRQGALSTCLQENFKKESNRKHKLSSHWTSNLKSKKSCSQSSINFLSWKWVFLKKTLGVRSFSSSSIESPKLLFFSFERSRYIKIFLILILKYLYPPQKNRVLLQKVLRLILTWFPPVLKFQIFPNS